MTPAIRAVIDTNILLSALVFSSGTLSRFRQLWQDGEFKPLVSKPTVTELIRVLSYPKFKLTPLEREDLLAGVFCINPPKGGISRFIYQG
jgi:uncharacterized protein